MNKVPRLATWLRICLLTCGLLGTGQPSRAGLVFSDTFQGPLSSASWTTVGNAVIVPDPIGAGNALAFSHLASGGDLYSALVPGSAAGTYTVGFDYLGACGAASACGGFLGVQQVSGGEHWLASDTSFSNLADQFSDTGSWQWVTFSFTATSAFQLKLEDFNGSAHAYPYSSATGASAYFANLEVYSGAVTLVNPMQNSGNSTNPSAAVPEPGTGLMICLPLVMLAAARASGFGPSRAAAAGMSAGRPA